MQLRRKTAESIPPNAADLIESLRDFGYTLPSALADLIDNSLTARAKQVTVIVEPAQPKPHIAVVDDGRGMTEKVLVEAMRLGTTGPLTTRSTTDLGRFGLGMKTASLSQGRCVTVISKCSGSVTVRRWDLAHVQKTNHWQLLQEPTEAAMPYMEMILERKHGTAVVIEDLDRASFLRVAESAAATHLATTLEAVRGHLAMVFHRFIEEDALRITLGPTAITAWDPFLTGLSSRLAPEPLRLPTAGGAIEVTPFVLPHHSRLTDEQHEQAAGPLGWNAHQGFYIYRCRRLIVPGTWLNLKLRKEEHYKLARIRVDLPNAMDDKWQLNVMKSHVSAPSSLLDDFRRIASDVRRQASEVYRVRGERQATTKEASEHFVWRREPSRLGVRFKVDRSHPVLRAMLHAGCEHDALLETAVALIESTLPVASILQEPQKAIDGSVSSEPPVDLDAMVDLLLSTEQHLVRTGKTLDVARNLLLSCEPFARFRDRVLDRLGERLDGAHEKGDE